uniref:Uncharacterized protein n=1 Tax=Candidatus Kentrum sp. MB TaxID=2138164 RepID=A0A450X7V3_9GAMM|nr:MAG: hypothetical protein BECKMB1821G_GA0114241_10131 [Candidatus Kentron sp. MB]
MLHDMPWNRISRMDLLEVPITQKTKRDFGAISGGNVIVTFPEGPKQNDQKI